MLHELSQQEFGIVNELFENVKHNEVIIKSVLLGNSPGRVFVDDPHTPNSALVYPTKGFYYIASKHPNEIFFQDLNKLFFEEWKVEIVELFLFPDGLNNYLSLLLGGRPHIRLTRRDYVLNQDQFKKYRDDLMKMPPTDFSLHKIDEDYLNKYGAESINESWSSKEIFLEKGHGFSLTSSEDIVSECFICHRADSIIELGTHTKENYRQHGLATTVCATLIDFALNNNLHPRWSCWEFNEPSWKLAEKLGFELKSKKDVILWDIYTEDNN